MTEREQECFGLSFAIFMPIPRLSSLTLVPDLIGDPVK